MQALACLITLDGQRRYFARQADTPLVIALRAINAATCQVIPDAVIDVWHCDAKSLYSGQNMAVDGAIKS